MKKMNRFHERRQRAVGASLFKFRVKFDQRLLNFLSNFLRNFPLHFPSNFAHGGDRLLPPSTTTSPASSSALAAPAAVSSVLPAISAATTLERAPANRGLALCICFRAAICDLPTAVRCCLALTPYHDGHDPATLLLAFRHVHKTRCDHIWCVLCVSRAPRAVRVRVYTEC